MNAHTFDKPSQSEDPTPSRAAADARVRSILARSGKPISFETLPPGGPDDLDWSDYDAGRIGRCSPDLMARAAHRAWRLERDGQ